MKSTPIFLEFKEKIFVKGNLRVLTGMHIGGNSVEMGIGGADSIVVRDPLTNCPYIPGSSLRGKMRSLLEKSTGYMDIKVQYENNAKPIEKNHISKISDIDFTNIKKNGFSAGPSTSFDSNSAQLFGTAIDSQNKFATPIPQRLVVRDAMLSHDSEERLKKAKNTDMPMTEVKTEVVIDRITSGAMPRQIERVPAGAEFGFEFILNLYGDDDETKYLNLLFQCMRLLQDDYLGGHGSRGYGRVSFNVEKVTRKDVEDYRENRPYQPMDVEIPEDLKYGESKTL